MSKISNDINDNIKLVIIERNIEKNKENQKTQKYSEKTVEKLLKFANLNNLINNKEKGILQRRLFKLGNILNKLSCNVCNKTSLKCEKFKEGEQQKAIDFLKKHEDDLKAVESHATVVTQKGGSLGQIIKSMIFRENTGIFGKFLDILQLIVDIAGMIDPLPPPLILAPMAIDAVGVILSLLRKDWMGAVFSAISMIPVAGSYVGNAAKYGSKFLKGAKAAKALKRASQVGEYAVKYGDDIAKGANTAMDYYGYAQDAYDMYGTVANQGYY